MTITLLAVAANILGSGMALPQAIRLIRHRQVGGVSPIWVAMSLVVNAWWLAYAIGVGEWAVAPVAVVSLGAYGMVAFGLARYWPGGHVPVQSAALAGVVVGAVPLTALIISGWSATGVVIGGLYGVQLAPAVAAVYRSSDLRGVSVTTWCLAWSEAMLWAIYGTARRDPGLISFGLAGLAVATAILFRLVGGKRSGKLSAGGSAEPFWPAALRPLRLRRAVGGPQQHRDAEPSQPESGRERDPAGHRASMVDRPDDGLDTVAVCHQ